MRTSISPIMGMMCHLHSSWDGCFSLYFYRKNRASSYSFPDRNSEHDLLGWEVSHIRGGSTAGRMNLWTVTISQTNLGFAPITESCSSGAKSFRKYSMFIIPYLNFEKITNKLRLSNITRNLWYHMIQNEIWCFDEFAFSCQRWNPILINSVYINRIIAL